MGLSAMGCRSYYAERHGTKIQPIDFETLKELFLVKFEELETAFFFREATGYKCVDEGIIKGAWGTNPEVFFFAKLKMRNLWPVRDNIGSYDELMLFSVIELLYDYVSFPIVKTYHSWNNCGWHTSNYDKGIGMARYRNEMNDILKRYKSGYELSQTGEILEIPPTGLEIVLKEVVTTTEPKKIDERINSAINKYRRYGATMDDKKDAVRTLADVLEFLRKEGIRLPDKDDDDLFRIINCFDIRHHNREQQGGYDKEVWYDWMFYTFLSSINALLKLENKYGLKT